MFTSKHFNTELGICLCKKEKNIVFFIFVTENNKHKA